MVMAPKPPAWMLEHPGLKRIVDELIASLPTPMYPRYAIAVIAKAQGIASIRRGEARWRSRKGGIYLGPKGKVEIIIAARANDGEALLIIGHELGHHIFDPLVEAGIKALGITRKMWDPSWKIEEEQCEAFAIVLRDALWRSWLEHLQYAK